MRKTGIPERGFRSRGRAKDLKHGRFAAAVSVAFTSASGSGRTPKHPAIPETAGDPIAIEPLEQELGIAATDAEKVAETRERDLPCGVTLGE